MAYEKTYDKELIRGDKWDGIFFAISKAGIDYTAATIKVQLRSKPDSPILFEKEIIPSAAGMELLEFTFNLAADETKLLNSNCQTDIEITNGDDIKSPILVRFKVTLDTTKN